MSRMFLVIGLVLGFALQAVEPPKAPGPKEDEKLFEVSPGKVVPAKEFFRMRATDPKLADCRERLDGANGTRKTFRKAQADLAALKTSGATPAAIDAQGKKVYEARKALITNVEECGECASREVERIKIEGPTDEIWYVTDGSCQIPLSDPTAMKSGYEYLKNTLLQLKRYSKKNPGGFNNILDFYEVDPGTGEMKPDANQVEKSPFDAYIAIRGPVLFGTKNSAFYYYFRNEWEEKKNVEGMDSFLLTFNGTDSGKFEFPDTIQDQLPSGKLVSTFPKMQLTKVIGQWWINSNGYIRYSTCAVFPLSLKLAAEEGRYILQDTNLQTIERALKQDLL